MDEDIKIFSTVGFPVFIALFVLIRLETALKGLVQAVQELRTTIRLTHPYDRAAPPRDRGA